MNPFSAHPVLSVLITIGGATVIELVATLIGVWLHARKRR